MAQDLAKYREEVNKYIKLSQEQLELQYQQKEAADKAVTIVESVATAVAQQIETVVAEANRDTARTQFIIILGSGIALIIGIGTTLLIIRSINRPAS